MGSIIKKKIKKQIYYYYAESQRVDGRPKIVNQKYLGNAKKLLEIALCKGNPMQARVLYSHIAEFGAVALLYNIATRMDIVGIIDRIVPKRKQGTSTGMYCLTEAINRALDPTSTKGMQEWHLSTILPAMSGVKSSSFTPQNFWNNTNISEEEVERIEETILTKMFKDYDIDTSHIIYDATNFFTYMDTGLTSELSKRGHSKEKRNDLRIVGLALMVSPDFSIPLLHNTYPGNSQDSREFSRMMGKLKDSYARITGQPADVTVVFDRGNNSANNIALLTSGKTPLHYVGGLKKNQLPELFSIPKEMYSALVGKNLEGVTAYRIETEVFARKAVAVITYNPALEKGQMQGILINKEKAQKNLLILQQRLLDRAVGKIRKGKKPTREGVEKAVKKILAAEYMEEIFNIIVLENGGNIFLTFGFAESRLEKIRKDELGKTALFTDRFDFSNEEIVNSYRSAWRVERAFKQLKDTAHLAVRPIFHWTDDKIRVHIFSCILAYRLCCLLVKELSDRGINISIDRMLTSVAEIRKVTTFFGDLDHPEKVESFSKSDEFGELIEGIYQLKKKYS